MLNIEELYSAYEADEAAAHENFRNNILRVTGVVDRIVVNAINSNHFITLNNAVKNGLRDAQCMFDKNHVPELNQLATGQTVTVQGKYDGYVINIMLRDCILIH